MPIIPYRNLFHVDWSVVAKKRWATQAMRVKTGWEVATPRRVDDLAAFVKELFSAATPVLAGFDFPVGLPRAYGRLTALADFPTALKTFGGGEWAQFYEVAETPQQISYRRPFYPRASTSRAKQAHLLSGLGFDSINTLRRQCERATLTRRAACPIFWTLGGNQVGKGAISGWKEVIVPALQQGARLWPFDGSLASLATPDARVLAETYPAEAYGQVGVRFEPGMSKRRQNHRREAIAQIPKWASLRGIHFSAELQSQIEDGFGGRSQHDLSVLQGRGARSSGNRRHPPPGYRIFLGLRPRHPRATGAPLESSQTFHSPKSADAQPRDLTREPPAASLASGVRGSARTRLPAPL